MTVPDGAQLSEDGKYWWNGADWQPVPEDGSGDGGGDTPVGQISEDGQWKWDGSAWQAVDGADPASGDGGGDDGLASALSSAGIEIAPEAADAGYIQQIAQHLDSWYGGLDENSKAIVDALTQQGADGLLADPEVGVVTEGDPLVSAFAANSMTLGESLEATNRALEQTTAS